MSRPSNWLVAALAAVVGLATADVHADSVKDLILRPLEDRMRTFQKALEEMERRTLREVERTEQWIAQYERQAAEVQRLYSLALTDASVVQGRLADSVGWTRSYAKDPNHAIHTPDGDMTLRGGEKMASDGLERLNQMRASMASGEYLVESAALGPTRRRIVEQEIERLRRQRESLQKGLRDGTLPMRIPGIGPTLGSACRAEVERLRKQIDETRALIAQGEYKVNVPGLGWHTRNSLQGLISRDREEIAGLRKSFNEMSFKIERPVIGIADRTALEQGIKSYQGELDKLAQNLSAGAGRAYFPQLGWRTGAELRAAKDDIDRKVSEWGAALSKEEYRAPVPYVGNVTEKELKVQIAQLLARATPDREGAAKLQAAIPVVHAYGSLHRGWWMAEANRYAAALAEYGASFDALRDFRMEQLSEREALRNEFDVDLRERVRQLEDEITYFERVIEQFIPQ